jgi:hypothetical protein
MASSLVFMPHVLPPAHFHSILTREINNDKEESNQSDPHSMYHPASRRFEAFSSYHVHIIGVDGWVPVTMKRSIEVFEVVETMS